MPVIGVGTADFRNLPAPEVVTRVMLDTIEQQGKLRDFCKTKGIMISLLSPLEAGGAIWGNQKSFGL